MTLFPFLGFDGVGFSIGAMSGYISLFYNYLYFCISTMVQQSLMIYLPLWMSDGVFKIAGKSWEHLFCWHQMQAQLYMYCSDWYIMNVETPALCLPLKETVSSSAVGNPTAIFAVYDDFMQNCM